VVEITEDSRDSYLAIEFDTRLRSFAQFLKATADDGWLIASGKDIEGKLKIDSKYFEKRFLADTRHLKHTSRNFLSEQYSTNNALFSTNHQHI
jgi:hypothetical protein